MQHIQMPDNVGSWILCSLEHSYMYKIILCSLFYLFSCYQTSNCTENTYFMTFPCGICIYTGKLPFLYYFQVYSYFSFPLSKFFDVDSCPSTVPFIAVKSGFGHNFSLHPFSTKMTAFAFSRFVFSSVSRLDATFVCAQNGKQATSHAP